MKSKPGKYLTLIAGLLVAVLVIFSQSASISKMAADSSGIELTIQEQDANAEGESSGHQVTVSVSSLPASPLVSFSHEAFCLFEIDYQEHGTGSSYEAIDLPLGKFLSILLGAIISPNAP